MENEMIRLPLCMVPNMKSFEKLGFVFNIKRTDSGLCDGYLPIGWTVIRDNKNHCYNILDEDNVIRAIYNTRVGTDRITGVMRLVCRYQIQNKIIDAKKEIYDFNFVDTQENKILYTIRYSTFEAEKMYGKVLLEDIAKNKLMKLIEDEYPDYLNPCAYWEKNGKRPRIKF